ncbi:hypothetical protein FUAX_06800 [Fulvitalea axinellae]|uniref:DUF4328 domain-containing protein n=1 Tax=Fulvitalea axinellae TaxID=1182444 RepID=A0AAU9CEI9_9BACT|nr:hypothetical protein FUAX_06800 [Fulvitalea axinellae]
MSTLDLIKTNLKDNANRARTVNIVFMIFVAVSIFQFFFSIVLIGVFESGDYELTATFQVLESIIALAVFGLMIVSIVVFLNWFRRAYGNLHRAGVKHLEYSETMAIWAFFIPFVNLVRPYSIMKEIWNDTQSAIQKLDSDYSPNISTSLVGWWWGFHIFSNIVSTAIVRLSPEGVTLQELTTIAQADLFIHTMTAIDALLVVLMVRKISNMESKLFEESKKASDDFA